jgi:ElaB/YqjD/DUF883 family membrane-anchored ribosome-binding protein
MLKIFKNRMSKKSLEEIIKNLNKECISLTDENKQVINTNGVLEKELLNYKNLNIKQEKLIAKQNIEIQNLNDKVNDVNDALMQACTYVEDYKLKLKQANGAKGGLIVENNRLKELVKDLTKKLEESMTDKYIVRHLPSQKVPKGQKMGYKSFNRQSRIIEKIYNNHENNE